MLCPTMFLRYERSPQCYRSWSPREYLPSRSVCGYSLTVCCVFPWRSHVLIHCAPAAWVGGAGLKVLEQCNRDPDAVVSLLHWSASVCNVFFFLFERGLLTDAPVDHVSTWLTKFSAQLSEDNSDAPFSQIVFLLNVRLLDAGVFAWWLGECETHP